MTDFRLRFCLFWPKHYQQNWMVIVQCHTLSHHSPGFFLSYSHFQVCISPTVAWFECSRAICGRRCQACQERVTALLCLVRLAGNRQGKLRRTRTWCPVTLLLLSFITLVHVLYLCCLEVWFHLSDSGVLSIYWYFGRCFSWAQIYIIVRHGIRVRLGMYPLLYQMWIKFNCHHVFLGF